MLLVRYIVFAGSLLYCCFWAFDALNGSTNARTEPVQISSFSSRVAALNDDSFGSLQDWHQSAARGASRFGNRDPSPAATIPAIRALPPTAERLSYERQLAANAIPAPVAISQSTNSFADARASMDERPSAGASDPEPQPKKKVIAAATRNSPNLQSPRKEEFSGFFFGRIFSN